MLVFEQYTSFVCRGQTFGRRTVGSLSTISAIIYMKNTESKSGIHHRRTPKRGRIFENLWKQPGHNQCPYQIPAVKTPPLTTAVLGGRAYSALPCAGAPPPQRPLSYNIPSRPGVYIRDGCLPERGSPHYVPSAPSVPCRGRPCACPRTPVQSFPTCLLKCPVGAGLVPALSLPKTSVNKLSNRWHQSPARLFPLQFCGAHWRIPNQSGNHPLLYTCYIYDNEESQTLLLNELHRSNAKMETRVTKWGNDLALRIPKSLANQLGLELNSLVRMSLRGDALVIAPVPPTRLKLDDLLDHVTAHNLHGEVDTGPAVGREAWLRRPRSSTAAAAPSDSDFNCADGTWTGAPLARS